MFAASISDSGQTLLSAVHCSAEDALLCGLCECCLSCALHAVTLHVLCLNDCNKVKMQQNALENRQALLSGVHYSAGDTQLCGV